MSQVRQAARKGYNATIVCVQSGGNQNFKYVWLDLEESLKVQLGLLERGNLPVVGVESARKVLDPSIQSNRLIQQAEARS